MKSNLRGCGRGPVTGQPLADLQSRQAGCEPGCGDFQRSSELVAKRTCWGVGAARGVIFTQEILLLQEQI